MRTKTKILTASIMAAGAASTMAQSNVYSLNIVGYVNIPVVAGKQYLLSNPFDDGAGDSINSILSSVTNNAAAFSGSTVFTFTPGTGYTSYGFSPTTGWTPTNATLPPGKGFWFLPSGNGTVTFTGSVVLTNSISLPAGQLALVGSAYPVSTNLYGIGLNWTTNASSGNNQSGDGIFRYDPTAGYTAYGFSPTTGWTPGGPGGPVLNVAEGFWYVNANGQSDTWAQSFTVN